MRPFLILICIISVFVLLADAIVAHTAPLDQLFLNTKWSAIGALHGVAGGFIFISATVALYLGYRLLSGDLAGLRDLQIASVATTLGALIAILLGNWIYIGYRGPGMVQDYFLESAPELHWIFFEFKEAIALFTLPLAVAATFILLRYGDQLSKNTWLRVVIFLLLSMVFVFFLITFGLGAAITKIKPA